MARSIHYHFRLLLKIGLITAILALELASASAVYSFLGSPDGISLDAVTPANPAATYGPISPEDRMRFEEIKAVLQLVPTGREALGLMGEYGVKVEFRPGEGTWYNWSTNMIVIDSNKDAVEASFSVVHEMTHASHYHQGMWSHLGTLSREEYIEQFVEEEAEGDIRAIEAKLELEATGVPVTVEAAVLEDHYLEAFEAAVTSAEAEKSGITEGELRTLGREVGKLAVIEGFMNGRVVTSTSLETYPSMYGAYWDEVIQGASGTSH